MAFVRLDNCTYVNLEGINSVHFSEDYAEAEIVMRNAPEDLSQLHIEGPAAMVMKRVLSNLEHPRSWADGGAAE